MLYILYNTACISMDWEQGKKMQLDSNAADVVLFKLIVYWLKYRFVLHWMKFDKLSSYLWKGLAHDYTQWLVCRCERTAVERLDVAEP